MKLLVPASLALLAASACSLHVGSFSGPHAEREDRLELGLASGDHLEAHTISGDVRVRPTGEPPYVLAKVRAKGPDEESAAELLARVHVVAEQTAHGTHLRLEHRDGLAESKWRGKVRVDYRCFLPEAVSFDLGSVSGDVDAKGSFGEARIETTSGDIDVADVQGDLVVVSVSGDLRARGTNLRGLQANTVSGDVDARGFGGAQVSASTVSGDLTLHELRADSISLTTISGDLDLKSAEGGVQFSTVSGDASLTGILHSVHGGSQSGDTYVFARPGSAVSSSWNVETVSGDVILALPADAACAVDGSTTSGSISTDLPLTVTSRKGGRFPTIRGDLGGGGPTVGVHTLSGDIRVRTSN